MDINVLYTNQGKLHSWNNDIKSLDSKIKIGDPLTIEYIRVHIVSDNFDYWGNSELMIVNYVKNEANKDRAMETITYHDDDLKPNESEDGIKSFSIGPFDNSEYGHPVCFHTPGYQGTVISLTTKLWELDDSGMIDTAYNLLSGSIGFMSTFAKGGAIYFSIADDILGITNLVLQKTVKHDKLAEDHNMEFRLDREDRPLLCGRYVCFPNLRDINVKHEILEEYHMEGDILMRRGDDGKLYEYDDTYFVLEISNNKRDDLSDFDYTSSASDLLEKLYSNDKEQTEELHNSIVKLARDSYDISLFELIKSKYDDYVNNGKSDADLLQLKALYNQLGNSARKEWFDSNFPDIIVLLNNK